MTFVQARDAIVSGLEKHIGCPVVLSDQIADRPEFPYCYYSVLTPRTSNHTFGLHEVVEGEEQGCRHIRSEPVEATMSFTFCGQNRETEDGSYIYGEDEALGLAEKGHGFFLLNGHCILAGSEDVVIRNVGSVANRSGFVVEDTVRRYGFDVRFAYIRTDEMPAATIREARTPGNTHE
ncbi:MAG: hypothetical protein HFF18_04325 [Oscillospiraceae bacterium]|nr:hypothetical protein [Oscillospiraceae bacterium]